MTEMEKLLQQSLGTFERFIYAVQPLGASAGSEAFLIGKSLRHPGIEVVFHGDVCERVMRIARAAESRLQPPKLFVNGPALVICFGVGNPSDELIESLVFWDAMGEVRKDKALFMLTEVQFDIGTFAPIRQAADSDGRQFGLMLSRAQDRDPTDRMEFWRTSLFSLETGSSTLASFLQTFQP